MRTESTFQRFHLKVLIMLLFYVFVFVWDSDKQIPSWSNNLSNLLNELIQLTWGNMLNNLNERRYIKGLSKRFLNYVSLLKH